MPARDLTKKEKTLFYINVGLVAFAFIFARISFGNNTVLRGITLSVHGGMAQIVACLAIGGIILVLASGQFTKGWDVLYIVLQILCIIGIALGLLVFLLGSFIMPTSIAGITDPETIESLHQTTQQIRGFLDRNPDLPAVYTQVHQALNICGFYDKKDELGIDCPYNIKEICESETSAPLLDMLLQALQAFCSVVSRNLGLILVIELVVFIFLISAYRSIDSKEMKKVTLSSMQPVTGPIENKNLLLEGKPMNPNPNPNPVPYYYAQPVNSQIALPVNSYSTGV